MIKLQFLNQYSLHRTMWLLVALTAFVLEMITLWLQFGIGLKPCTLCIYERYALFGIISACLIGVIAPKTIILRYIALIIWLYSSWEGIQLSWQHTVMLLYPTLFTSCDFSINFPSWFPLDKWLPYIFATSHDCSIYQWQQLPILISPQWLIVIFVIYFSIAFLLFIVHLYKF